MWSFSHIRQNTLIWNSFYFCCYKYWHFNIHFLYYSIILHCRDLLFIFTLLHFLKINCSSISVPLALFFNTNKIVWYILKIDLVNHRAQSWHSTRLEEEDDKDRIEWPSSKKQGITYWWGCGENGIHIGGNVNWYSHCGEQYGGSLKNWK